MPLYAPNLPTGLTFTPSAPNSGTGNLSIGSGNFANVASGGSYALLSANSASNGLWFDSGSASSPAGSLGVRANSFSMASNIFVQWTDTSGNFYAATVDIAIGRGAAGRAQFNNGTAGTFRDAQARQLFAAGDNAGLASNTSLTNATDATTTNAYTVKGGQVATTPNTGWIKIYVGTAVAWIPYWQNATP